MSNQSTKGDLPYTGLILLSGIDTPGITEALFSTLAPFAVTVLDVEQVVIRERVILTVMISLNKAHASAIEADLEKCALSLGVDIATSFSQEPTVSIAAKTSLLHVVAMSSDFKPAALSAIAGALAEHGGNIERIFRTASYPLTAIEFVVSGVAQNIAQAALASISGSNRLDIAVQPGGLMRWAKKLVLMDMDSTLIQQEVIELLAQKAGVEEEVKIITQAAMRGEMDFEKALRARVLLLKGLDASVLELVRTEIVLTPGARTLLRTLARLGHTVGVVSGGFIEVIEPIMKELGIEYYAANSLEIAEGKLTGELIGPIIDRAAKARMLQEVATKIGVQMAQTIAIGDGANDLDMIAAAGLGIAFNAKPVVQAAADSSVTHPYLDSVLYLMGIAREDIEEADGQSLHA